MKIRRRIPNWSQPNNNKKKLKQPNIIIPLIVAILVIIWWIYYIKVSFSNMINWNNNSSMSWSNLTGENDSMKYFIWDVFSNSWVIMPSEWTSNYSQILIVDWSYTFWLKSNDFLLSEYTWAVLINWQVADIFDSIPVVLVTDIVKIEDDANNLLDEDDEESTLNNHNFPDYWLSINFEMLTWYKVSQQWNDINILKISDNLNESDSLVVTITPYECKVWSSTQDCSKIIKDHSKLWMNTFTTTNGVKFYKFSETDRHVFFNSNVYWFNVIPKTSSDLDSIAWYLHLDDYSQLKESIITNISKICSNEKWTINSVIEFDISMSNWVLYWNVSWKDIDWNSIKCKIKIWNKDSKKFTLLDLQSDKVVEDKIEEEIKEESEDIEVEETEELNSNWIDTTSESLVDSWAYLSFVSNLWFTVHLPKYVAYEWAYVQPSEDFWYDNVNCPYKVNVINYKNKDLLSSSPSVQVFYCNIQWSINTSWRPIKKVDTKNWTFLLLYSNDEWRKIWDEIIIE